MEKIRLDNSEMKVSKLAYGTGGIGLDQSLEEAFLCLDTYYNLGGNFFDTAHVYSNWAEGEKSRSEKTIGKWLRDRKIRDKIYISTKGAHPYLSTMDVSRVSKKEISIDLEESLAYLGTDYIDLYFLHRDNLDLEIEEIIEYLEEHKKKGNISYYGLSNYTPKRIEKAIEYANKKGYEGLLANQSGYSCLKPEGEVDNTLVYMNSELRNLHTKTKFPFMAYSPLQNGLHAKIKKEDMSKQNKAVYDELEKISKRDSVEITQVMLSYLYSRDDFDIIPIIGTKNVNRIKYAIENLGYNLYKEDIETLDKLYFV